MLLLFDKLLYTPPGWIVAVIVAMICSHAVHLAMGLTGNRKGPLALIIIIELFILLILGYLTVHLFLSAELAHGDNQHKEAANPYVMLYTLILFGLASVVVYACVARTILRAFRGR